jgi:hypothetical protein
VRNTQLVDPEQIDADYWFGKMRGRLLMEIEWSDAADVAIPYKLVTERCWMCGGPWVDGSRCEWPFLTHGD